MLANALPEESVRLGRRLASIDEDDGGVDLRFDDGTSERFDLVVGADGLSSRVREHVEASQAGEEGSGVTPPTYSGIRVQFGVVPGTPLGASNFRQLRTRHLPLTRSRPAPSQPAALDRWALRASSTSGLATACTR